MKNVKALAKAVVVATTVTAVLAPTLAYAKERGQRASFEQLDADQSGEVTLAEMEAAGLARFVAFDADSDGFLTKDEMTKDGGKRAERRVERMFERRDANEDGKLSTVEMRPATDRIEARFAQVDADNSGGISKEEFEAMKAQLKDRRNPATD